MVADHLHFTFLDTDDVIQARAGIKPGFEHDMLNVSASVVAHAGYRGLMANKRVVLPSLGTRIIPFLLRLFPRGLVLAAIGRLQLRNAGKIVPYR